jgi:hypothetical protein
MHPINARFWTFVNAGPVKLVLAPGQTLRHYKWWRHEEGWSSESTEWSHRQDCVEKVSATDGTDCDGRLSTYNALECRIENLHMGANHEGIGYPEWERMESSQRDYSAEAMGY